MYRARLVCLLLVATACSDSSPTDNFALPPAPIVSSLTALSAVQQTIVTGSMHHDTLTLPRVIVRDEQGRPMSGVTVSFVADGGLFEVYTDHTGKAVMPDWRVALAGTHTASASVSGNFEMRFVVETVPAKLLAAYQLVSRAGQPINDAQSNQVTLSFYANGMVEYRGGTITQAIRFSRNAAQVSWKIKEFTWDDQPIVVSVLGAIAGGSLTVEYNGFPWWTEGYTPIGDTQL